MVAEKSAPALDPTQLQAPRGKPTVSKPRDSCFSSGAPSKPMRRGSGRISKLGLQGAPLKAVPLWKKSPKESSPSGGILRT